MSRVQRWDEPTKAESAELDQVRSIVRDLATNQEYAVSLSTERLRDTLKVDGPLSNVLRSFLDDMCERGQDPPHLYSVKANTDDSTETDSDLKAGRAAVGGPTYQLRPQRDLEDEFDQAWLYISVLRAAGESPVDRTTGEKLSMDKLKNLTWRVDKAAELKLGRRTKLQEVAPGAALTDQAATHERQTVEMLESFNAAMRYRLGEPSVIQGLVSDFDRETEILHSSVESSEPSETDGTDLHTDRAMDVDSD